MSCETFTASVSTAPAATFVICRVWPLPPTLTAPNVLFHVAEVSVEALPAAGSKPATPLSVLATDLLPSATPSATVTLVESPSAVALATLTLTLLPSTKVLFAAAPSVLLLPTL
ncbi:hypothetical protein D3C71_1514620 [compost metagenome]